jgi:hypothetical protein
VINGGADSAVFVLDKEGKETNTEITRVIGRPRRKSRWHRPAHGQPPAHAEPKTEKARKAATPARSKPRPKRHAPRAESRLVRVRGNGVQVGAGRAGRGPGTTPRPALPPCH